VGDEGGFAPNIQVTDSVVFSFPVFVTLRCSFVADLPFLTFQENKEGLELLKIAIEKAGYTGKVSLIICNRQSPFSIPCN